MADSKLAESSMKQMLECSVCFLLYGVLERIPRSIPCGHTFCSECIVKLVQEGSIQCPRCRKCSLAPAEGPGGLPTNYSITDMLEVTCNTCLKNSSVGQCNHCNQQLCESCREEHLAGLHREALCIIKAAESKIQDIQNDLQNDGQLETIQTKAESYHCTVDQGYERFLVDVKVKTEEAKELTKIQIDNYKQNNTELYLSWKCKLARQINDCQADIKSVQQHAGDTYHAYDGNLTSEDLMDILDQCQKITEYLADVQLNPPQIPDMNLDDKCLPVFVSVSSMIQKESAGQTKSKDLLQKKELHDKVEVDYDRLVSKGVIASEHKLKDPWAIAVSVKTGHIYITEQRKGRIHVYDKYPSMDFLFHFGSLGKGKKQFHLPKGVAVDKLDRVFIADSGNHRVQVTSSIGKYLYEFELQSSGEPAGMFIDHLDQLFICDRKIFGIVVTKLDGTYLRSFGCEGSKMCQFSSLPCDVCVLRNGNVAVTDISGNIHLYINNGTPLKSVQANSMGVSSARGVAVNTYGHVAVADYTEDKICFFDQNVDTLLGCIHSETDGYVGEGPTGLTFIDDHHILATMWDTNQIQMFEITK